MRIKNTYKVRKIAGENLIVEQGKSHSDMTKVISINATALLLWENLQGKEFTLAEATDVLTTHFNIATEQAEIDANKWIEQLTQCGMIE